MRPRVFTGPWRILIAFVGLLCAFSVGTASPSPGQGANAGLGVNESSFSDREASLMLSQIADALGSHNSKKMLAVFDTSKMSGGPAFRQQINSFFAQTTMIRVHFNLVQAGTEEGRNFATVDAEMEVDPVDDRLPPVHKQAQLRFQVESSGSAWKFTDVQPRTFFSPTLP